MILITIICLSQIIIYDIYIIRILKIELLFI